MADLSPSQQRRAVKRRKAAVGSAVEYLNVAMEMLPGARKGNAERQVRESPQPMTTAKALVKDWCQHHRSLEPTPTLTSTPRPRDERAALIRAACAMELGHAWPAGHGTEAA